MKGKLIVIITFSFVLLSCGSSNSIKSNLSNELIDQLKGYWINTDSDYKLDKESTTRTILYYGPIDKNKEGLYIQGDKKMRYRVIDTYEYYKKIVIAIYYANGRERVETLTFSENYTRIKNNLVFPDGISVDTYYIKKKEK